MSDECDHSEKTSEMISQDSMLLHDPHYEEINKADDNDDESLSHGFNEPNKNIGDHNVTTTNGDTAAYSNSHKDGNCASTGARKKEIDNDKSVGKTKNDVHILYNKNALTKLASTYKLEMFEKNLLIIYNFINVVGYTERVGTIQDADELEKTFKMYGFEVEREGNEDLTCRELLRKLDEFDKRDFSEYGCVAIVVMTHGTWGGWLMAKDGHFSENEIINRMKTRTKPSLITKPVVLIIQACRGTNSAKGVRVDPKSNGQIYKDQKEETYHYYLPVEVDMLVFHSSYVGKPAYRPKDGTWFIQTLCKKIRELAATEDFESILREVKKEVAIDKDHIIIDKPTFGSEGQIGEIEFHKQVPTVTSLLIRKLYLFKKIDIPFQLIPNGNVTIKELFPIQEDGHGIIFPSKGSDECACLLSILKYFINLLRNYAAENVYDTHARCLLQQATADTRRDLDFVKLLVIAISNFLKNKYQQKSHNKFIYWYGDDNLLPPESQNISVDGEELEEANSTCKKVKINYVLSIVVGIGAYIGIHVAHNFLKNL